MRSSTLAAGLLLVLPALTGCGPATAEAEVAAVAGRFAAAVQGHDGAAACALLGERTRRSVESGPNGPCAQALSRLALPVGRPGAVTVWGDGAQVRAGTDTVFLAEYASGWRVTAAGCRPQGEELPYDCELGGS